MDRGVLLAISEYSDANIRFVDLVEVHFLSKTRHIFLCVGEHGKIDDCLIHVIVLKKNYFF